MATIETIILDYLNDTLEIPAYAEIPANPTAAEFVVIDRTGRSEPDRVTTSMVAFQSYAKTKEKAAALNDRVEAAVKDMIVLDEISGVRFNTSYNFTDPSTKQYRYQCVFDITHY